MPVESFLEAMDQCCNIPFLSNACCWYAILTCYATYQQQRCSQTPTSGRKSTHFTNAKTQHYAGLLHFRYDYCSVNSRLKLEAWGCRKLIKSNPVCIECTDISINNWSLIECINKSFILVAK